MQEPKNSAKRDAKPSAIGTNWYQQKNAPFSPTSARCSVARASKTGIP
jgi:hypothetical protein